MDSLDARPGRRWPLAAALVLLLLAGCSVTGGESAPTGSGDPGPTADAGPYMPPLDAGDPLPALEPGGWVNGPPPAADAPGVKLLVVDAWAHWCPFCRLAAPGLVRVHKKYADRGVVFVSVTNMTRLSVETYVKEYGITWPNGYLLPGKGMAALHVSSGQEKPRGYEIAPTVYLAGPDGRVRWSDRQGRFRHADVKDWERDLDAAIEAALAPPPDAPADQPDKR